MQLSSPHTFSLKRHRKMRLGRFAFRIALWLSLVILVIQLVGMGFHNHGLTEKSGDCVSCALAADLPSPTPDAPTVAPITALVLAYAIATSSSYSLLLAPSHYLTPLAQAPPQFIFPI